MVDFCWIALTWSLQGWKHNITYYIWNMNSKYARKRNIFCYSKQKNLSHLFLNHSKLKIHIRYMCNMHVWGGMELFFFLNKLLNTLRWGGGHSFRGEANSWGRGILEILSCETRISIYRTKNSKYVCVSLQYKKNKYKKKVDTR